MRKVELKMRELIRADGGSAGGNTLVTRDYNLDPPFTHSVYLHGHHIADAWADCTGKIYAEPDRETLEAWPTVTTMSRLRALGIDVSQMDHWVYLGTDRVCEAR